MIQSGFSRKSAPPQPGAVLCARRSIVTDSHTGSTSTSEWADAVGNFGWRPAAIAKAIERFNGPNYVYPGYSCAPWTELARLLASLAPRPLTTCFRATGRSEAVDVALQAPMIHTGRRLAGSIVEPDVVSRRPDTGART